MQSRMAGALITNIQLLDDMKVFEKANWPENIDQDIRYGEKKQDGLARDFAFHKDSHYYE